MEDLNILNGLLALGIAAIGLAIIPLWLMAIYWAEAHVGERSACIVATVPPVLFMAVVIFIAGATA